jgi:hypothetical protein
MGTMTEAELVAEGWTRVTGAGERIQFWTGIDDRAGAPDGMSAMLVWDSTTGRRKIIDPGDWQAVARILVGCVVILRDLLLMTPTPARQALAASLLQALKDD